MSRLYDRGLYRDAYDAAFTALDDSGAIDFDIQYSDLPGDVRAVMKQKLAQVFERVYEDAYQAGRFDEAQDRS